MKAARRPAARYNEVASLHGRVRPHHQFRIGQQLKTIGQLEGTITAFDKRIEAALEPFREAIERLKDGCGFERDLSPDFFARPRSAQRPMHRAGGYILPTDRPIQICSVAGLSCRWMMPERKRVICGFAACWQGGKPIS